ncbi:hypothetical protein R1sor_017234 [Riccia sorocarpa]|uniref:Uncharacterized protein n=1 Tax=Riccia sorocarpa TaxID=122646 RepID=A0ABD3I673_9MARC
MAAQAEAPLHFELYSEEDDVNYIMWKWISRKKAHRVLCGIDATLLKRSGLHDTLWMDWARPEEGTTSVREFILNWDDRTQSSTIGGREVPLTIDTVREYFLLPEGSLVPRTARHYDELSTWVPERSKTAKTWYANDVYLPVWRPIIQLVNVVLLGKQKPLEVTGAFLYILKNKVGHADEDEDLDCAAYFKEKIREEIRACKKQMQASGKRKVKPTCIGIVVLHILRTCGIVDDEDIVQSDSDKSVEEVTSPRSARAPPVQEVSSSNSPDRVQDLSSSTPDRVQDLSSSSPEGRQVNPDPRDIPSSSSPGRHQDRPPRTDIPSSSSPSSSPGRRKQDSPTRAVRRHSPESSPGGAPSTLSDHATRSGSPSSPDRQEPDDNEPLAGFAEPMAEPMVPYPPSDDEQVEAVAVLTSLAASDPLPASKGKRPVLHRSSSESEEIRFVRPDRVKRRVADPDDDVGVPVSQQAELAHCWSQEQCIAYQTVKEQHKDGFLRCKSVQVLYDFGICTKDVIIIDDTVQKNSPNHPFQAANWQAAQAQDPIASLAGYWAPMDERDEDFLWSNCTAADRQKFLAELSGHRLKLSAQKAMQFSIADADQPSQTQDGAGPSNSSRTAETELGRPIFPAPLSAASLVSNAEILLAGCRDDDMELSRLHGDY